MPLRKWGRSCSNPRQRQKYGSVELALFSQLLWTPVRVLLRQRPLRLNRAAPWIWSPLLSAFLLRSRNTGATAALHWRRRKSARPPDPCAEPPRRLVKATTNWPRPHSVSIGPGLFCTSQPWSLAGYFWSRTMGQGQEQRYPWSQRLRRRRNLSSSLKLILLTMGEAEDFMSLRDPP
jgi:hypothetical protein